MPKKLKFPRTFSSISMRYKFSGAFLAVIALTIGTIGLVTYEHQKSILEDELRNRAEVLTRQLANLGKEALLTQQELTLYSMLQDLQKNSRVVYAMILDSDGKVFAHTSETEKGKILSGEVDRIAANASELSFQRNMVSHEPVLEAALPIFYAPKNLKIGVARVGLSEEPFWDAVDKQKLVTLWIFLSFITAGLIVSVALAKVLTKPIYTLAVAMQASAQGDFSKEAKVFYQDEVGKLTETFNHMVLSMREKLHMEKYLSYSTLKTIKKNRNVNVLKLGGELAYVTALFSDVRGFTAMSEKMKPEEVIEILNIYLNMQSKIIHQRGGTVDKFIGDQVMAIFEGEGSEVNAVRAAVEIQRGCQALNFARLKAGKRRMLLGIGINSGDVVMGNIGSEEQMDYTVVGDNINMAARLCSVALPDQIVMTQSVADAVKTEAAFRKLEPISLKGKMNLVEVYEVLDAAGIPRKNMRRDSNFKILYRQAGAKQEINVGTARNMSSTGCLLESKVPIDSGSRLDLDIQFPDYTIYVPAVVRHAKMDDHKFHVGLQFEEMEEKDSCHISEWVHSVETISEPVNN